MDPIKNILGTAYSFGQRIDTMKDPNWVPRVYWSGGNGYLYGVSVETSYKDTGDAGVVIESHEGIKTEKEAKILAKQLKKKYNAKGPQRV